MNHEQFIINNEGKAFLLGETNPFKWMKNSVTKRLSPLAGMAPNRDNNS